MERFRDFAFGSPAEREARRTYSEYKHQRPRDYREKKEQARALVLRRGLNRRQLILGGVGTAALAGAGGIALREHLQPDAYHGPLEDLEGLPLLSSGEIDRLANILYEMRNPLLRKIADDVYTLATVQKNPAPEEFPGHIVRPDGFPAPVAENTRYETSLAVTDGSTVDSTKPPFLLINSAQSRTSKFQYTHPYYMGIVIGTAGIHTERQKAFDYARALLIAKEFMTLMFKTGNARNAYPYFVSEGYSFANEDRTGIKDPLDQQRAAYSVYLASANAELSPQWRMVDGGPILLLTAMIEDSKKLGGYQPGGNFTMSPFDDIAKKRLDEPGVHEETQAILDGWTQSPYRFLPHDNLIFEAFNESGAFSKATQQLSLDLYGS